MQPINRFDIFDVEVITQNIDDLHEQAGSQRVLHLHGELQQLRRSKDENLITSIEGWEQKPGDRAGEGSLLRPFGVSLGVCPDVSEGL